jgi:hypothetical protein
MHVITMTEQERNTLLRAISFEIGCCQSVKPEEKAKVALAAIELQYSLVRK